MRGWWESMVRAWVLRRWSRLVADSEVDWTVHDAQALGVFLSSAVGKKLGVLMCVRANELNQQAVAQAQPWVCGWAYGVHEGWTFLKSLTEYTAPQDGELQDAQAQSLSILRDDY